MLEETVQDWVREWKQQGMELGEQKGMQKGEVTVLKRLILRRYGSLPQWAVMRLEQADTSQLEEWSERIFDAQTLEELLRREHGRE